MMKFILPVILFVLLLVSPEDSRAEKNYRVVVFGDGITSGYQLQQQDAFPAKLEQKLRAAGYDHLQVINLGNDTITTAEATTKTDEVNAQLPDVVIVQLGYNDTKRGVIASAIASNLNTILSNIQQSGAYVILVGVPAASSNDPNYANDVQSNFYTLAANHKIALYPSALEGIADNPELTMADGRHPNTAGVDIMVNGILPLVDTGLRWRYELYEHERKEMLRTGAITAPPEPQQP